MNYKINYFNEAKLQESALFGDIPDSEERQEFANKKQFIYDRFTVEETSTGDTVLESDNMPDLLIVGGLEVFKNKPLELVESPPKYIVKIKSVLWDALQCKNYPRKTAVTSLEEGTKILLFDCDPEATQSNFVGVRTSDLHFTGYINKANILKDPEA